MEKEFIPYEQALELNELGFNEPCLGRWLIIKEWEAPTGEIELQIGVIKEDYDKDQFYAPLYQQAFRWFRDKKLSDGYVYRYQDITDGSINYGYSIINNYGIEEIRFIKENYTSYEEAELECLKELINLVKTK